MTTIDAAVPAIKQSQNAMQAEIDLLKDSDANADVVITMLVSVIGEIRVTGANTTLKRSRLKHALEFAAAHLGSDVA